MTTTRGDGATNDNVSFESIRFSIEATPYWSCSTDHPRGRVRYRVDWIQSWRGSIGYPLDSIQCLRDSIEHAIDSIQSWRGSIG